jgi:hypothetical protein
MGAVKSNSQSPDNQQISMMMIKIVLFCSSEIGILYLLKFAHLAQQS